jgi:filamentous hemagglutinin
MPLAAASPEAPERALTCRRHVERGSHRGWHAPSVNASQFTISKDELQNILQRPDVVGTAISRTRQSVHGVRYERVIDVGQPIGVDKFSDGKSTSVITVLTDRFGNLVTVTPGRIR